MIEAMVVVALVAVLAALVAPSFIDQLARRRLEGVATDLSTDLQFARMQAVSDRDPVRVVTEVSGSQYRLVRNNGTTLKTVVMPAGVTVTNAITISYDQLRGASNAAQITLSSTKTTAQLRVATNVMGRVSMCSPAGSLKGYTAC